jgi:hypothetical protein
MWPIFSCLVFRYFSKDSCGATSAETRSTTAMPPVSRAATFSGLLVIRRTGDAEEFEDFGGQFERAAVCGVAQFFIGFYGVATVILKFVGSQLGHEADAAALLLLVEQDACACLADLAQGELQLQAAIAAQGAEDVAG